VVRKIWENMGVDTSMYASMDGALRDSGSSLPAAFSEFATWCYFVGDKANPAKYFRDGALFFKKSGDTRYSFPPII